MTQRTHWSNRSTGTTRFLRETDDFSDQFLIKTLSSQEKIYYHVCTQESFRSSGKKVLSCWEEILTKIDTCFVLESVSRFKPLKDL